MTSRVSHVSKESSLRNAYKFNSSIQTGFIELPSYVYGLSSGITNIFKYTYIQKAKQKQPGYRKVQGQSETAFKW